MVMVHAELAVIVTSRSLGEANSHDISGTCIKGK